MTSIYECRQCGGILRRVVWPADWETGPGCTYWDCQAPGCDGESEELADSLHDAREAALADERIRMEDAVATAQQEEGQ